MINMNSLNI